MKRRIKALAVIMAAVLMVSGAGSTLYENGVKADAKDTLKWNSAITKVKVKKRVALTVNVEASKVQCQSQAKMLQQQILLRLMLMHLLIRMES